MSLIDQRILIAAPMSAVWEIIADHQQLHRWRSDCQAVSVLSTQKEGQGVRRRITPTRGKDFIEEFKAWYNGLGYEYQLLDTKRYKYNLSRIRLQATPDGTIVQWTIEFELKGFLRRLFGKRRNKYRLAHMQEMSLRELRRYVGKQGVMISDEYRTKAGVQQAPDAKKRAEYGAQIFSTVESAKQAEDSSEVVINEPPVRADDTPSIPKVMPPSFITSQFDVKAVDAEEVAASQKKKEDKEKTEQTRPTQPVTPEMIAKANAEDKASTSEQESKTELSTSTKSEDKSVKAEPAAKVEISRPLISYQSDKKEELKKSETKVETPQVAPPASTEKSPEDKLEEPSTPVSTVMEAPETFAEKATIPATSGDDKLLKETKAATKPKRPEGLDKAIASPDSNGDLPQEVEPVEKIITKQDTDQMSIWEVFGVDKPADIVATPPPETLKTGDVATLAMKEEQGQNGDSSKSTPVTSKPDTAKAQEQLSLDEILAMEEPPLPANASASVQTIVRENSETSKVMGMRRRHLRKQVKVRSKRDTADSSG